MKLAHWRLLAALIFPVVALLALTGYKAYKVHAGVEVILPIAGYDPRDLLSGHYLIYRLDLPEETCPASEPDRDPVYLCVDKRSSPVSTHVVYSGNRTDHDDCAAIIRGRCEGGGFLAGVERFYIPEQHSRLLDRIVRGWGKDSGRTKLVLSVDLAGKAVIKDLLIDGKPLRKFLAARGGGAGPKP